MIRRRQTIFSMCLFLLWTGTVLAESATAIVGARVYTMQSATPLERAAVLIRDGQIVSVGARIDLPDDAEVIDATGMTVTPAFMNSATHLGLTEVSSVSETTDFASGDGVLGAAFDIQYALNAHSELVRQARVDGLSRAITFPGAADGKAFSGLGSLLRLTHDSMRVERAAIALFVEVGGDSDGSRSDRWLTIRRSLDTAQSRRRGRQGVPTLESISMKEDLEVLESAAAGRLPLVIAAHRESDIREAIALAKDYGMRIVLMGGIEAWAVADELAGAKIPVILDPTLNLPLYFDQLRVRDDSAAILDDAGVLIGFRLSSIHTSFNAGFSLREAAGIAVANGLGYFSALKALTLNPARIWGIADRYGVIAPGRDADLVVWDGDPFEPASAPSYVYLQGRRVSPATRQSALRDRYRPR